MKVITGQFCFASGPPAAGATLKLQLSQDSTTGGQQIAPVVYYITLDTNGNIPAGTEIWANDELSPNTFYVITVTVPSQGRIYGPEEWPIVGTSPINLNTIVPKQLPLPTELEDLTFTANTDFAAISSGENIQAEMTVGSGASLEASGSGVINATEINGIPITGTLTHAGQIPISQPGNETAVWADPLVQGIQAAGTTTSTINPVLIGIQDGNGNLQAPSSSNPIPITVENSSIAVTGTFWPTTQPVSGTVAVSNFPATQAVSGTISVSNFPTTQAVTQSGSWTVGVTGSVAVTGTFWQATQPISAASLPLPSNAAQETGGNLATLAGTVSSSKVNVNVTNSSIPVTGTFWQSTQPVSLASLPALASGSNLIGQVEVSNGSSAVFTSTNPAYVYDVPTPRANQGSQSTTITNTTGSTTIITAISSTYADIFSLTITNSSLTQGTTVTLSDGTVSRVYYVAGPGGFTLNLNGGVLSATSSNTNWTLTCGTATTSIYVVAEYYKRSS